MFLVDDDNENLFSLVFSVNISGDLYFEFGFVFNLLLLFELFEFKVFLLFKSEIKFWLNTLKTSLW